MNSWQPIETYPPDNPMAILYSPPNVALGLAGMGVCIGRRDRYGWGDYDDAEVVPAPTRWMPLPDPPEEDESQ